MLIRKKQRLQCLQLAQQKQCHSNLFEWVNKEMQSINYNISEEICSFYINEAITLKGQFIMVEMYAKPNIGIFANIEFRPKMLLNMLNFSKRPKIYNDRRIFHPNINIETCEIVYSDLCLHWNPASSLVEIIKTLKYTIIQPNPKFVPNNALNKKAAWNYHFNRDKYADMIIQNSPKYLEDYVTDNFVHQSNSSMDIEYVPTSKYNAEELKNGQNSAFWSIDEALTRKKLELLDIDLDNSKEEFDLLAKKIRVMNFSKYDSSSEEGNSAELKITESDRIEEQE